MLSRDELDRAARFHSRKDEARFVARRGLLRELLGRYVEISPVRLVFFYGAGGKPSLASPVLRQPLHFNLSHSNAIAVFAMTREAEIGIDVEEVRRIPDLASLVVMVCSAREQIEWLALPSAQRPRAFFDCWTRKEAFLKGLGQGLHKAPNEIEVPLRRIEPDEWVCVLDRGHKVPAWSLRSFSTADYALALALKDSKRAARLCLWEWQAE
jgi:4'-phosphopantetheinyl transferase